LDIYRREFFALLGPSGCGKTTLMRLLAGFEIQTEGRITIDGQDMAGVPPNRRAVNMMIQAYALFPHLSVADNVGFGLRRSGGAERGARVERMLAMVGMTSLARRFPHELSGGQQQRVAIARSLCMKPKIMLFDEPTSNLDINHQVEFYELISRLNREKNLTILTVSHDINLASEYSQKIILLKEGRIFKMGSPREVVIEGHISQVYGSRVLVDENPVTGSPRITLLRRDHVKMDVG